MSSAPEPTTVLELEAKVTALTRKFPAIVVCVYDVNTLPGQLILTGGFQTHPSPSAASI